MLPAHMVYWFCTFKNQARFPPPINKHRYDCERYRALKKGKNVHTKCYSFEENYIKELMIFFFEFFSTLWRMRVNKTNDQDVWEQT